MIVFPFLLFPRICRENDKGSDIKARPQPEEFTNHINRGTQCIKSTDKTIGDLKLDIQEGNVSFVPGGALADLPSQRREKIDAAVQTAFASNNKDSNTLNRLQLVKESENKKHKRQDAEKQVVRPSGRLLRTVVLRKEDPLEIPRSKSRSPGNPSPWHELLSQASRHFRTEDAETIQKIRKKIPPIPK